MPSVHPACLSDGVGGPAGCILLFPVLVTQGPPSGIHPCWGREALASCRNGAAMNILCLCPGAHVARSETSRWDWLQNLQDLITEENMGPWDKLGVSTRQLQSPVPGVGWVTTWVQDTSSPPPRAMHRACAVWQPLAHRACPRSPSSPALGSVRL